MVADRTPAGSRRAWRGDAGLVALAAVLGALLFADSWQTGPARSPGSPLIDIAAGLAACAALLLSRRWPVGVAAALVPSLLVTAAAMGATPVALGALARYRSWRAAAVVLALHAALVAAVFGLVVTDRRELWQGLLVVLALDVAAVASGLLARSRMERAREMREAHRLRLEEARHAERERIAREMHDVLAHRLSLLAVQAGALSVRRSAPEPERQAAAVIRESAFQALEDLRQVIGMLRDDGTDAERPQPTLADLPALVEQSRRAGEPITLDLSGCPAAPDGTGRHAYRIVQEGLTNARKHAPGAPVQVRVAGTPDSATGLTVEITNPVPAGAGARLPGAGSGLAGLRERVSLAGGRLEDGPTPDGHFQLRAWLPWQT